LLARNQHSYRGEKLKKSILFLTLLAFLAGPILHVPETQAASESKTHSSKAKSTKAKAKSKRGKLKTKAKSKIKAKSKTQAEKPRPSRRRVASRASRSKARHYVQAAPPPLRALSAVAPETLQGDELDLRSSAALVVDQKSGVPLYAKNIDVPTSIASITKLMTAMVTLDAGLSLDEEIEVNSEDVDRLKGTGSRLALGTRLTREELLHLALIASENRAASALSRVYPGGRPAFIAAMNRKARELGMRDSHFVDGTGLNSSNRATAADLVKMVDAAYRYPLIREISSTGSYDVSVPGTQVVKVRQNGRLRKVTRAVQRHVAFNNTNSLTRSEGWEIGVSKTGYINEAGHCLVMQTKINEQRVIIVLLDSVGKWGRIGDAQRIRKWLEHDTPLAVHKEFADSHLNEHSTSPQKSGRTAAFLTSE
jgi:D-alanyl-D-alanine endopeptidase (penicillin-binding protein 7)